MDDNAVLKVVDLSHSYGKLEVLKEINLNCYKNETIALLGINGAGKSSLLNIITNIIVPTHGKVYIGQDNLFTSPDTIKKNIGYLSESNPLYEDMYVKEYLKYIAKLYLKTNEVDDRVDKMIEQIGLTLEYKKKIATLSKGNKQRVGLAQALIHNPDIIILDEPMNGLDLNQQNETKELIAELRKDKLIILSSHHLAELEDLASRYLILHQGKIIFDKETNNIDDDIESIFNRLTQ